MTYLVNFYRYQTLQKGLVLGFSALMLLVSGLAPIAEAKETVNGFFGFEIPKPVIRGLPDHPERTFDVTVTAYTSAVEETDDSPFVTADGSTTRDGIVAANFLPFGTKIRLPALFGDKVFTVHDRMNQKYWFRVDVWMHGKREAFNLGVRRGQTVEVVSWGDNKTQWAARAAAMRAGREF